jgi:hypothetical protein
MDSQIEAGINDALRSHTNRGIIRNYFNRDSSNVGVQNNRKRFMIELMKKVEGQDEFVNQTLQEILEKTIIATTDEKKIEIAKEFVTRIQQAIATIPPETETEPAGAPPQDPNTSVSEDSALNQSMVEKAQIPGLDFGGKRTRKRKHKHRKTLKLRKDRPIFAEELDKPLAGGKKHRK